MRLRRSCLRPGTVGTVIALAVAGLLLPGASTQPASAADSKPVPRVMVVGDSVAHQFAGDYTWRYRLAMEFKRQQAPVDFVGPFRWGYGEPNRYLVKGWDSDHDAQGATVIKHFRDLRPVPGAPYWGERNIVPTMRSYAPDVLVSVMANNDVNNLMAGHNYDLLSIREGIALHGRAWAEPKVDLLIAEVLTDYQALIASARAVNPSIKLVIAEITSQFVEQWVRDEVNAAFTEHLTSTPTSPVVIAQTDDPRWSRPGFTADGIHTTPTGDLLMAQRVAEAIHLLPGTPLPAAARIPQRTIRWNPVITPSVRVSGRRIYLAWGPSARASTVLAVRVKLVSLKTRKAALGGFHKKSGWNSAVLKPGRYQVQLQGLRGDMTSTWGRIHTVTIPKPKK